MFPTCPGARKTFFLLGLAVLAAGTSGCLDNHGPQPARSATADQQAPADFEQAVDSLVQAMARAAFSTQAPASPRPLRLVAVQVEPLDDRTGRSPADRQRLARRLQDALERAGRRYGLVFDRSEASRTGLTAHRLQVAALPVADDDRSAVLLQMGLTGPDHAGRIVCLWQDQALVARP